MAVFKSRYGLSRGPPFSFCIGPTNYVAGAARTAQNVGQGQAAWTYPRCFVLQDFGIWNPEMLNISSCSLLGGGRSGEGKESETIKEVLGES